MKKIVLAFDDGRKDQYTNAYRILKDNGLVGSIFITTGFVDGTLKTDDIFLSAEEGPVNIDEIREMITGGFEIGIHADKHTNEPADIFESKNKLLEWCSDVLDTGYKFGFASPSSNICEDNISSLDCIKDEILYIRSGTQVRRNGIFYSVLYIINTFLHSNVLFYLLNKREINTQNQETPYIKSVTIKSNTKLRNIKYFIKKVPDDSLVVLLFHSIKTSEYHGYYDTWCFDSKKLESLCQYIKGSDELSVLTLRQVLEGESSHEL